MINNNLLYHKKSGIYSFLFFALCPLLFTLCLTACDTVTDNNPVNNLNSLPVLRFSVSTDDLLNMYNNRFSDYEMPADLFFKNENYKVRLEASGAGSRYFPKYSFEVSLNDEEINGLDEFNISAQVYDKTGIKTVLTLFLYEASGFTGFYSEPVFVTMNNENFGLYALIEEVDDLFFLRRNIPVYELYQVKFDAKFTFSRKNNVRQNFEKEMPENDNFENLERMIAAIDEADPENIFAELGPYLDIEQYLIYHAVTSIRHDPDAFTNNFFLYKETPSAPFKIIPWDFDKTFDAVGRVGFYGQNDLIEKLFLNDSCRAIYKNYMSYYLKNIFTEDKLYPVIDELAMRIKDFYNYDPYLNNNIYENEVNFLKTFITERRNYMLNELKNFN